MLIRAALLLLMALLTGESALADDGVLVLGGTGRLGAPIVRLLLDEGERVTVFARPTSDRERLRGLDVQYAIGDLLDAPSVAAALAERSYRVIVDASARGASPEAFYDTAMQNVLDTLAGHRVEQFILHGSVGAGGNASRFPKADWSRLSAVLQAKGQAEKMLIDSGIAYTIIRNGLVQRDGTPATGDAYLTEDTGAFGAVTRADLALLTMQCFEKPEYLNKILHAVDDGLDVPEMFRN